MRINFLSVAKNRTKLYLDTISRWAKTVLVEAGIDTNIYKSHSICAASTTKVHSKNVPLHTLMKAAGLKSENTFHRFNSKLVQVEVVNLTEAILS